MSRPIGNLSLATDGLDVVAYYRLTPHRWCFVGLCWMGLTQFGRAHISGVKAFVAGPLVCGRYDRQAEALSTKAVAGAR